jgi:tetratricopeptide (TPR) repeat protein
MTTERGIRLHRRTQVRRWRIRAAATMLFGCLRLAEGAPYTPANDAVILANVPAGARHTQIATRLIARKRLDVALLLAQFYIKQARSTGDLRFLGYAQAVLETWTGPTTTSAEALVLHATVLQSRHEFPQALAVLRRALDLKPDDAQAWLTVSTVLRVLGRYEEALQACHGVSRRADTSVTQLCEQGLRGLTGELRPAYDQIEQICAQADAERAWRDSELGEMAVRLGDEAAAERWFRHGLRSSPEDFYIRGAYADLLLRTRRPREALALLQGRETLEPLLLRIAIAQKQLNDPGFAHSRARLKAAFAAESQRGDGVHRREESRFLLEVENDPRAALEAAVANWQIQREVDDVLVLVRAANAAGSPKAAAPALDFVRAHGLQDVRLASLLDSGT